MELARRSAASGVEDDPDPARVKVNTGQELLRLPEVSFRRGPAKRSRKLLSTGKHARVPAGAGVGIGVPAIALLEIGAGMAEGAPRGSPTATG